MATVKFKLMIEVDGVENLSEELGFESLGGLAHKLPDIERNSELFGYLAKCPSSNVRFEIADKDNLKEETVDILSQDASIEVRRRLCRVASFKKWASTELLLAYIQADVECATIIASEGGSFSNIDANKIYDELYKHPDSDVRNAIAKDWNAPRHILERLLSDPDASVRASAMKTFI